MKAAADCSPHKTGKATPPPFWAAAPCSCCCCWTPGPLGLQARNAPQLPELARTTVGPPPQWKQRARRICLTQTLPPATSERMGGRAAADNGLRATVQQDADAHCLWLLCLQTDLAPQHIRGADSSPKFPLCKAKQWFLCRQTLNSLLQQVQTADALRLCGALLFPGPRQG